MHAPPGGAAKTYAVAPAPLQGGGTGSILEGTGAVDDDDDATYADGDDGAVAPSD